MLDDADNQADEQDLAETFDETHREGEDPLMFDAEDALDPDLDDRAYDATSAIGDEDEDLDDLDDDDLDDEDLDDDEEDDVEEARGEGLAADRPESDELIRSDRRSRIVSAQDEAELTQREDLDDVAPARNRQADKFESTGPLSDEQIADLGYGAKPEPKSFAKQHQEELVDEGLEETFPASDPVSVSRTD